MLKQTKQTSSYNLSLSYINHLHQDEKILTLFRYQGVPVLSSPKYREILNIAPMSPTFNCKNKTKNSYLFITTQHTNNDLGAVDFWQVVLTFEIIRAPGVSFSPLLMWWGLEWPLTPYTTRKTSSSVPFCPHSTRICQRPLEVSGEMSP